ncbi:MAG: alpha-1,2-fucosyltransferase [Patescibacteria group bacterium]
MIISRLNGGLGNQMFQYAVGRVVSYLNKTDYFLDLSLYDNQQEVDTPRSYELHTFNNIKATPANKHLLEKFTKPNKLKLLLNHYLKLKLHAYPPNWIKENGHNFYSNILRLRGDYLLDGYWQTEKYFKKYRNLILEDFTFPKKTSKKNREIIKEIIKNQAISLHVRRGDYVSNKLTNAYHGVVPLTYYKQAINLLAKKITKPLFVVFSDDPQWCKDNLPVPKNSLFVDHNKGKQSFEDMRLMSLCKHNIIANSSFSWWGAWLNQNKNKIVVAPDPWFKNKNSNTTDIIPNNWIKIRS